MCGGVAEERHDARDYFLIVRPCHCKLFKRDIEKNLFVTNSFKVTGDVLPYIKMKSDVMRVM